MKKVKIFSYVKPEILQKEINEFIVKNMIKDFSLHFSTCQVEESFIEYSALMIYEIK